MKSKTTSHERRDGQLKIPPLHDWRTTDEDEINRRRQRARDEQMQIANINPREKIFSNFRVRSPSGLTYQVEIRDFAGREFFCTCVDFRINGLGTCKHVEAVLLHLDARFRKLFASAKKNGSPRIDIVPDRTAGTLRVARGLKRLPRKLSGLFDGNGLLADGDPEEIAALLRGLELPELRISREIEPWLESRRRSGKASCSGANTRRKSRPGYIRRMRRWFRCFPISARG
jgi:hypothetical protein